MSDTPPAAGSPSNGHPPSIPDHALLHRIGAGSYGEVWLARNVMGTLRAVKIVYRRTFDSDRPYEREFAGLQKFEPISRRHESQLDILHVGRDDARGCFYYVMELADPVTSESVISNQSSETDRQPLITDSLITDYSPRTLRSDLARHGRLPVAECVRLGLALATALEHLHSHGLVHRDIKPSNIVFVEGQPKLADIGLVTDADATMSCVGTEGYMPPEGPGAPQADVFGLGKVLYEISTGRDRKEFPDVPKNFADLPDAEKEGLREFNAIVLKACQPRPADRYATAAALRKELELLRAGQSVRQHHTLQTQLKHLKHWGRWALAAFALAGLLVWHFQRTASATRRQLLLREVQMARQGARTNGWFDACWEKLREVARLKVDDDARTQAAACLSGLDARLVDAHPNAGSFSLAFSPDGQWLLCASLTHERTRAQQSAHLWRVSSPSEPSRRRGNESLIKETPHLAGDQRLVTSSPTNQYDAPQPLPVSGDAVAAWTTSGTPVLFLPGPTNCFLLVEARTSNVLREFTLEGNPHQGNENHPVLAITPDARLAAVSVTLADDSDSLSPRGTSGERAGERGTTDAPPRPENATTERSADASSARSAGSDSRGRAVRAPAPQGRFAVWDTVTGQRLFQTNEPASALAFSPDGRALAVGDAEGRVRVFALPEPEPERGFAIRSSPVTDVSLKREERAAAPPERGLAVRIGDELEPASHSSTHSQPGPLRIANPRPVALLAEFPSARVRINCFAFTRDPIVPLRAGPLTNAWWLAVGDAGGTIHIWRTATGEQVSHCRGSSYDVFALAFHPDGVTLASAGRVNVRLWDAVTGEPWIQMTGQQEHSISCDFVQTLSFTSDEGRLAFANESGFASSAISVWELAPHRGVRMLRGLATMVSRVWLSPDDRWLAALANNWQLAVWELPSGRLQRIFETPQGATADNAGLTFHLDATRLAFTTGADAVQCNLASGVCERAWGFSPGLTDHLAFDREHRLWSLRRERLPDHQGPARWILRVLDESGGWRRMHEQQDAADWLPNNQMTVCPDRGCFVVAGWDERKTFWKLACFNITNGAVLWAQTNSPEFQGYGVEPDGSHLLYRTAMSVLRRALPSGAIAAELPFFCTPGPGSRVFATAPEAGCQFINGTSPDSDRLTLGCDYQVAERRFTQDGRRLVWGTQSGVVFVADLDDINRRLTELGLGW